MPETAHASLTAQLIATAALCQPTPSDRRVLARAALRTAIECVEAKDYGAAHAFIEDALAQVRALRGLPGREG